MGRIRGEEGLETLKEEQSVLKGWEEGGNEGLAKKIKEKNV